jgi:hypothetical protein
MSEDAVRKAIETTRRKFPRKHAYRSLVYAKVTVDDKDVMQDVGGTPAMIRFFVRQLVEEGARKASASNIKTGDTFAVERLPSGMLYLSGFI